jgi:hypothetical protein
MNNSNAGDVESPALLLFLRLYYEKRSIIV